MALSPSQYNPTEWEKSPLDYACGRFNANPAFLGYLTRTESETLAAVRGEALIPLQVLRVLRKLGVDVHRLQEDQRRFMNCQLEAMTDSATEGRSA
jgi:hypothetical protein